MFCNAQAIADDLSSENDVPFVRTLAGAGGVLGNPNLALIKDDSGAIDMDQRTSGVDFLAGCDTYYHTPFDVRWDGDNNGSFETAGPAFSFDATAIDGPASFSIPVHAAHPLGGSELDNTAAVSVLNVAPAIAGFTVTNSAGQRIGIDVPFALVRTPVTVERIVHGSRPGGSPDRAGELGGRHRREPVSVLVVLRRVRRRARQPGAHPPLCTGRPVPAGLVGLGR